MKDSEDRIQSDCFTWLWNTYPKVRRLCFHVPNGGLRSARESAKLKAMGVIPGIPDLILAIPGTWNGLKCGCLFIEMKTPTGRPSDDQMRAHMALKLAGNAVVFVRSIAEFKLIIEKYLEDSEFAYI